MSCLAFFKLHALVEFLKIKFNIEDILLIENLLSFFFTYVFSKQKYFFIVQPVITNPSVSRQATRRFVDFTLTKFFHQRAE